ncbi:LytTR family transcriptional regulator DNA-binding domain-containing protein [Saccharicrinis fermentans]|uniref:LytTr DNA-binding domain protein n=1 Tax=Saccharicrinis fermentans DSM 9555 = JCM 21142 TaxID=869213 RepID=W7Y3C0_9BACT|nr:LytTr DNA-binding domain protein [Saccharicrinis fermentans DSM 9555 = JCM 21142]
MLTIIPENYSIKLKHITHIKNESNLNIIFTINGKNNTSTEPFYLIKRKLKKQGFLQVNNNTLVNTSFIDSNIKLGDKRSIRLFKDTYVNISRKRLHEIREVLN